MAESVHEEPGDEFGRFEQCVRGFDVGALDVDEIEALLGRARRVQRVLDGLIARVAGRAEALAGDGRGVEAGEVLRAGGEVSVARAKREAGRAVVSSSLPQWGEALSAGEVTGEHVDVVARHLGRVEQVDGKSLGELEGLVADAQRLPVEVFARTVGRVVARLNGDHGLADAEAKRAQSQFRHWFDSAEGLGRFTGALDPLRYEMLVNAIDHRVTILANQATEAGGAGAKNANTAAAALVDLVTASSFEARSRVPSVTVIVDAEAAAGRFDDETICETGDGQPLAPETAARLCCDATIRRVTVDAGGVPIDVGRSSRTATDAQWSALRAQYRSCGWDGCTAPLNWCQAHHIHEWEHGGPTDLHNLIPLCSRHHHLVHEGRWTIKLLADRSLRIHRPDGTLHANSPPPSRKPPSRKPPSRRPGARIFKQSLE